MKGWINVKFGDIAESITDIISKPKESGLKDYIGLDELDTDQIRIKRFASTEDVNAQKFLCKKGDIIFGKRNAYLRKVAVSDRDAVASAHSMILRSKGKLIYNDFLPCLMQSSNFWKIAQSISEGSMSPTIKWRILAEQEFLIPPMEQQKKISELLWAIEKSMQETEELINLNEKLKIGLLNDLLTKGINHNKFKKTEIGEIPEEWNFVKISEAILINPPRKIKEGDEVKFVAMENLIEREEKIKGFSNRISKGGGSKFMNGDTLMARITPCLENGKTALVDILENKEIALGSTEFIVLSPIKDMTISKYVYYLTIFPSIRNAAINSMIGTSGRQRVPNSFFNSIKIGIPPIDEQKRIVIILDSVSNLIKKLNLQKENTFLLKKKLTNKLISGEIILK